MKNLLLRIGLVGSIAVSVCLLRYVALLRSCVVFLKEERLVFAEMAGHSYARLCKDERDENSTRTMLRNKILDAETDSAFLYRMIGEVEFRKLQYDGFERGLKEVRKKKTIDN